MGVDLNFQDRGLRLEGCSKMDLWREVPRIFVSKILSLPQTRFGVSSKHLSSLLVSDVGVDKFNNLRGGLVNPYTNSVILKNLTSASETPWTDFIKMKNLRGGLVNPYTNFVILKNLKGGKF